MTELPPLPRVDRPSTRFSSGRQGPRALLQILAAVVALLTLTVTRTAPAQVLNSRIMRDVQVTRIARVWVSFDAAREYQFRTSNLASGVDPFMHLLDAANVELAQNDDTEGLNPLITFSPTANGSGWVVVRSYSPYSAGNGQIDTRSRLKGASTWPTWNALTTDHFGGAIVGLTENQQEYWTVAVQPAAGGCPDTMLYAMNSLPYKI